MTTDQSREADRQRLHHILGAVRGALECTEPLLNLLATVRQAARQAEREVVAKWLVAHSFSTGHGDTLEGLLGELAWQVEELRGKREAVLEEAYKHVRALPLLRISEENMRERALSAVIRALKAPAAKETKS